MKFFNIAVHCSVIEDVKFIFNKMGHEVVDWSLSGHAHTMKKKQKKIKLKDGSILEGCPWASHNKDSNIFWY